MNGSNGHPDAIGSGLCLLMSPAQKQICARSVADQCAARGAMGALLVLGIQQRCFRLYG